MNVNDVRIVGCRVYDTLDGSKVGMVKVVDRDGFELMVECNDIALSSDPVERVNAAIAVPLNLTAEDGRVFEIANWAPEVYAEEVIYVNLKVLVRLPSGEE